MTTRARRQSRTTASQRQAELDALRLLYGRAGAEATGEDGECRNQEEKAADTKASPEGQPR